MRVFHHWQTQSYGHGGMHGAGHKRQSESEYVRSGFESAFISPAPLKCHVFPWLSPPQTSVLDCWTSKSTICRSMRLRLSLLQSWSIIDTITSHCHDVPQAILPEGLVSLQPTNATPTTTSIPNLLHASGLTRLRNVSVWWKCSVHT